MKDSGRDIVLDDLTIRITNVPLDQSGDVEYFRNLANDLADQLGETQDKLGETQAILITERNSILNGGIPLPLVREWLTNIVNGTVYSAGNKINLIKAVRMFTNMGLKESKDLVDSFITTITY